MNGSSREEWYEDYMRIMDEEYGDYGFKDDPVVLEELALEEEKEQSKEWRSKNKVLIDPDDDEECNVPAEVIRLRDIKLPEDSKHIKVLKRDVRREMLRRLEQAARTVTDFNNLNNWYDYLEELERHRAWVAQGNTEVLVPVGEIAAGDEVIVRMGNMIPLDGKVTAGAAMVNQQTMTGESMPVKKEPGSYVYGGTVVEEGECRFIVDKTAGSGRYDRIVKMIEESEKMKSVSESKAADLADRLVPYSLAGTIIAYILTRNPQTALAFLMVDYSCALKLTMPLAVLAAMRESGRHSITVKGGKFLEMIADADTIVFDKTGTLTNASPTVVDVVPFGGNDADEMLRIAACLEEHYPHSMANAVVEAARVKGLEHEEMHSEVEYVVAHGITSIIDGDKASIGSYHFIFEDEGCIVPEGEEEKFESLPDRFSLLYLAVSGRLSAVICIEDPVREGVPAMIQELRDRGFSRIVMMTGDNRKAAAYVADKTGVDEYVAEVLPEDKAGFVRSVRKDGHRVVMIGDGINDSPALSEADAGIAVNTGAAIAREIADITIEAEDLSGLLLLKDISDALMRRIDRDYRVIISFNSLLIVLGAFGVIAPATSAMLHNLSTIAISVYNMTDLLED